MWNTEKRWTATLETKGPMMLVGCTEYVRGQVQGMQCLHKQNKRDLVVRMAAPSLATTQAITPLLNLLSDVYFLLWPYAVQPLSFYVINITLYPGSQ